MATRAISRRGLLIGGGCVVAAAAVGIPTGIALQPKSAPTPQPSRVEAMLAKRPFTVAHRGGSWDWPEESRYSYLQSSQVGVDALEMSVSRTSDGVWIGSHDPTLDRLSGTKGFYIKDHTWAEVEKYLIRPPSAHSAQESRPYWLLDDLIATYHASHALWVDPKAVNPTFYPGLIAFMKQRVPVLKDVFVAKSSAGNTAWAEAAGAEGMQSWGFYYGSDLDADPTSFDKTNKPWTMLGLDWNASDTWWKKFTADGRPVVAHVLNTSPQRDVALKQGARGLMIGGVTEILG